MQDLYVIMYEYFTALDVFGPVDVLSRVGEYSIHFVSLNGGIIQNKQGLSIETYELSDVANDSLILIPGGFGSRKMSQDEYFLSRLKDTAENARYVLCVCTGSALLARTGLLDGRAATSNKLAFDWVRSCGENVNWISGKRWVTDGKYYTSAGVSAGIDMALGFVKDLYGVGKAREICEKMEYSHSIDDQ